MNDLTKYLKATKSLTIKPHKTDIEKKILQRIENLSEADKKLLDEKFLEYLKKSNSRPYLFAEWVQNNPGKIILAIFGFAILGFFVFLILKNSKNSASK